MAPTRGEPMTVDRAMRHRPPSGHQYSIAHGGSQAMVTQVGATLRSYTVDRRDVIDGFGIEERAVDGRGQVLAPWPNRLTDGRYRYGDRDCQAPLNEPNRHGAIHGLVRWLDWSLGAHDARSVTLSCAVRPQPGYEWQLDLEVTYALDHNGLTVTCRALNVDTARAPFGVGFHPYLMLGSSVDGLRLTVPAMSYLDPNGPPRRPVTAPVAATSWDFTRPRRVGTAQLDTAYGDLVRGEDGRAVARLADPDAGRSVRLWVDDGYNYLMVYTADHVGQPERPRAAIAVEPMTCPPDALRSGTDLIELDPGASWHGSWGIQAEPPPAG
jgi:aldose 1-epimerase